MSRRALAASGVGIVLVTGLIVTVPAQAAAPDDDAAALALLARAAGAGRAVPFSGTQVRSAWPGDGRAVTELLDVEQDAGGRTVTRRDPAGAGSAPAAQGVGGARSARALAALAAAYAVRVVGPATAAGRPATLVTAARSGRVAARLWVDEATGLLLREEVLDARGGLFRMSAFLDVRTGAVPAPGTTRQVPSTRPAGLSRAPGTTTTAPAQLTRAELDRRCDPGWRCPDVLPGGFRLLDARLLEARPAAGAPGAVHLTYGDGLTAVSLFLQPGRLAADRHPGLHRAGWNGAEVLRGDGWPDRMTWQAGPMVVTVVSDAPPADLAAALAGVPHATVAPPDTGAFAGLRQGLRSLWDRVRGA